MVCPAYTEKILHQRSRSASRPPRAFSLIELLVVISIVAVLLAILIPAAARCRFLARYAREMSATQQLMVAYTLYSNDHRGAVLPGYPPAAMVSGVVDGQGRTLSGPTAQRYPWRLAPYLDFNFKGLYKDDRLLQRIRDGAPGYGAMGVDYNYIISLFPSLGLNVAFVGGSTGFLGFNPAAQQTLGRFYVTRIDQAQRPSRLIVFASARESEQAGLPELGNPEGFFRVEPPSFTSRRWQAEYDKDAAQPGLNSGFVSLRWMGRAVTAALDGHSETLGWDDLQDMTRWADGATRPDWVLAPR